MINDTATIDVDMPCAVWSCDPVPSVIDPTAMVAAAEVAEEEVPTPVEEEGKVAELLTPHFPYIPDDTEGLLPSIFDKVDGPSLKV